MLESLDRLLGLSSPATSKKVIAFIRKDATDLMRGLLNHNNFHLVRPCLRIVNAVQEASGDKRSILPEQVAKEIYLLMLEKSREIRKSAARFFSLTVSGPELLRRFLEMVIQYEVILLLSLKAEEH